MTFDLYLNYTTTDQVPIDDLKLSFSKLIKKGWSGVALTRTTRSTKDFTNNISPLLLNVDCQAQVQRNNGLHVLGDFPEFLQLTRINVEISNIDEFKNFVTNHRKLTHDIISVTPLTEASFKYACAQADVDIVTLDATFIPKENWKSLASIHKRNKFVELKYSQFLREETRERFITLATAVSSFLKGRHTIFSAGTYNSCFIRSPSDVRCLAKLLGFRDPDSVVSANPRTVIVRAMARKSFGGFIRKFDKKSDKVDDIDDVDIVIV